MLISCISFMTQVICNVYKRLCIIIKNENALYLYNSDIKKNNIISFTFRNLRLTFKFRYANQIEILLINKQHLVSFHHFKSLYGFLLLKLA